MRITDSRNFSFTQHPKTIQTHIIKSHALQTADKEQSGFISANLPDIIDIDGIRISVIWFEYFKLTSVKSIQPVLSADPQKSEFILIETIDCLMRKSLPYVLKAHIDILRHICHATKSRYEQAINNKKFSFGHLCFSIIQMQYSGKSKIYASVYSKT